MLHVIIQPPFDEIDSQHAHMMAPGKLKLGLSGHIKVGQSTKNLKPDLVLSVIADGAELAHILQNFTGLPVAKINNDLTAQTDMRWFGDDAKFIVANWT